MNKLILFALLGVCYVSLQAQSKRDPYLWPFSSTSIWNMPIHKNAVYVAANLNGNPSNPSNAANAKWALMPGMDDEHILLTPTAPLTTIKYCTVAWGAGDRCIPTNATVLQTVPMPSNYVVPDGNKNSCAAFLAADGRTIMQNQPLARCTPGGTGTALVTFPNVDLYGSGERGNHGGSGLSGIGGSIRLGELRPGQKGPRHALKIVVYAKQFLYPGTTRSNCYRWPATTCDSYAVDWYGSNSNATNKTNTDMKMGALLAIPPTTDITKLGLETEPGKQIAWTLQNYGAYIVDDTYAEGFLFCSEVSNKGSVAQQFQADYGQPLIVKVNDNTSWMRDIQRLCLALRCVSNNSATNIGGGPTTDLTNRMQPMACAFDTPGSGKMCPEITTNITEEEIQNPILVYPNPFNTNFTLQIASEVVLQNTTLEIYDLCGKEVKKLYITSNEMIINRDDLQTGLYFYRVTNDNNSIAKGKLVIQ